VGDSANYGWLVRRGDSKLLRDADDGHISTLFYAMLNLLGVQKLFSEA
jgi:hypothetical protein